MNRIKKIQNLLQEQNLDALILDNPTDLYYLLSQEFSLGRLVIQKDSALLFVDGRYYESACVHTPFPVRLTQGYGNGSNFLNEWSLSGARIGFDAECTTYSNYELLKLLNSELVPLSAPVKKLREIKDHGELKKLKNAAELGSKGFDFVLTLLEEGVTEKEIAKRLEIFWLNLGADRLGFPPHIAFGEGASQPHYHSGERELKKGDCVLIDIGVVLENYHSDMTRVVAFEEPKPQMHEIYQSVFEAFSVATKLCAPGVLISTLDRAAREVIEKQGYGKYFPHGLGHGVGLEIHELPKVSTLAAKNDYILEEGMVITIEPGIYLPGVGGVRLEDMFAITSHGCLNLTQRPVPQNLPIYRRYNS